MSGMIRKYKQHLGGNEEEPLPVWHIREDPDNLSNQGSAHRIIYAKNNFHYCFQLNYVLVTQLSGQAPEFDSPRTLSEG